MLSVCANLIRFLRKKMRGQGLVEYGLIISLIALAVVFALKALGAQLVDFFNSVNNKISSINT